MPGGDQRSGPDERGRQLDALRARVMAVVGHALRTPVTTLRGLADLLPAADEETLRGELIPAVRRSAATLEHLVDDLLVAVGIEPALPVGSEAVDVRAALVEAWRRVGGEGELPVGGAPSLTVRAAPAAVRGILERVLDNARKYGEGPVSVELGADPPGVVVRHAGGPLGEDEEELAFEPLWRSERAVMRAAGLGLGLPVARRLAAQTGGTVVLSGRDGIVETRIVLAGPGPA